MELAERKAEHQSIEKIEAYQKVERQVYKTIEKQQYNNQEINYDGCKVQLMDQVSVLKTELLDIEILLQDALLNSRTKYIDEIKKLNKEISEITSDYF